MLGVDGAGVDGVDGAGAGVDGVEYPPPVAGVVGVLGAVSYTHLRAHET